MLWGEGAHAAVAAVLLVAHGRSLSLSSSPLVAVAAELPKPSRECRSRGDGSAGSDHGSQGIVRVADPYLPRSRIASSMSDCVCGCVFVDMSCVCLCSRIYCVWVCVRGYIVYMCVDVASLCRGIH